MLNMNNLKRQHIEIETLVKAILYKVDNTEIEKNAFEIAKSISTLAGKLKIHLNEEDRSMYPSMKNSSDPKLINFHNTYQNEMKDLFSVFMDYKNKYNTRTKILSNINEFVKESKIVLTSLISRVSKEDKYLYPLLSNK